MGIGYSIRKMVMKNQKEKARREAQLVGISPKKSDEYQDAKRKEEYILRQKLEREAEERRLKEQIANKKTIGQRLKAGAKAYKKRVGKSKPKFRMGLGNTQTLGQGPQFGLTNRSAFDLGPSKKGKKGPFDL